MLLVVHDAAAFSATGLIFGQRVGYFKKHFARRTRSASILAADQSDNTP
jgi:hypothetical protein